LDTADEKLTRGMGNVATGRPKKKEREGDEEVELTVCIDGDQVL
jgi:hypothetical protein